MTTINDHQVCCNHARMLTDAGITLTTGLLFTIKKFPTQWAL